MYYIALVGFAVFSALMYALGVHDGRIDEQRDEARRRIWQHRLNQERNK